MGLIIKMQIDIEADNLTVIRFTDTTKAYQEFTNETGYGGPNFPSIAEIESVNFSLVHKGVTYTNQSSEYLPSANGEGYVDLLNTDFISGEETMPPFEKGGNYELDYSLEIGGSSDSGSDSIFATPQFFVFPCFGSSISSNLGTKFTITEKVGCISIDFKDTTGTYNSVTNPGGYGAPNFTYSDITSTLIKITLYDGTIVQITDFIPTALNQIKNITASDLGYSGTIVPQVVRIEYSVYGPGGCQIGYKNTKVLLHCVLRNCIVSKGASILQENCGACDSGEVKVTISLIHRYEMLLLASYDNIDCIGEEVGLLYEECQKYCGCS